MWQGYEVNYGSKYFQIYLWPFDIERCKQGLLDYVQAAQPGRIKVFARQLDAVVRKFRTGQEIRQTALELAALLMSFTYDVIERSRRRAIQEAVLLARNAKTDKEIRTRLLDYLQEGMGAESLQDLLEQTDVELTAWYEILEKVITQLMLARSADFPSVPWNHIPTILDCCFSDPCLRPCAPTGMT